MVRLLLLLIVLSYLIFVVVGVNMQPDYMVRFGMEVETGQISTDEETIIIGFSTQEKHGILLAVRNEDVNKPEFISIEVNNNGKPKH